MAYQVAHLVVGKLFNLLCSIDLKTAPLNKCRMDNSPLFCIGRWSYTWNNCFAVYLCTHLHSTQDCLPHVSWSTVGVVTKEQNSNIISEIYNFPLISLQSCTDSNADCIYCPEVYVQVCIY